MDKLRYQARFQVRQQPRERTTPQGSSVSAQCLASRLLVEKQALGIGWGSQEIEDVILQIWRLLKCAETPSDYLLCENNRSNVHSLLNLCRKLYMYVCKYVGSVHC